MTGACRRYRADWVVPVAGPPIPRGAVLIGPDGRIRQIGPADHVPAPAGSHEESFEGAAILPGLVNAHTHLELTGLDGQVPDEDFPAWILHLVTCKSARSEEEVRAAARQGVREAWASGVTTVADTGDSGAVLEALAELGGSGIAYHEVFGPDPAQAEVSFTAWVRRLEELSRFAGGRVRLGASPHAPYTVSGELYRRVAAFARACGLPLAVHLAESVDESRLLRDGSGGFAVRWRERGIPFSPPGCSPVEWLAGHGVLGPDTLCIHVVQAADADLDCLATAGSAVAHCPRSNRHHRHGAAPLAAMLRRGLRVGVGTDSAASVAPLDLLADAREARSLAALSAAETLALVTLGAARAIGLGDEIGSLEPGKWGDLAVMRLPGAVDADALADTLVSLGRGEVVATVLGGREVFRHPNRLGRQGCASTESGIR